MTDRDLLASIDSQLGSLRSQIATQLAIPAPGPGPGPAPEPTPKPTPPAPGHDYPGPDLWVYPHTRLSTGDLPDGGFKEGGFTVPDGWVGILELPISGAYLHAYIDDQEYTGPTRDIAVGKHNLKLKAQGHTANGSADVVHTP